MARSALSLLLFLAVVLLCSASFAAPFYVSRVAFTNDGTSVFSDDFASGGLARWDAPTGATVVPSNAFASGYCLSLQGTSNSQAYLSYDAALGSPGVVELTAVVWLPKQAEGDKGEKFKMYLRSGTIIGAPDRVDSVYLSADWEKTGYSINAHWTGPGAPGNVCAGTKGPVLQPQKWATLTLRLDARSGRLSALLDSVQKASTKVIPGNFMYIKSLALIGSPTRRTSAPTP